jgi:hypothetical protein
MKLLTGCAESEKCFLRMEKPAFSFTTELIIEKLVVLSKNPSHIVLDDVASSFSNWDGWRKCALLKMCTEMSTNIYWRC